MGSRSARTGSDRGIGAAALALAFPFATTAFAAHPLLSEDTGTQGTGHVELELGFDRETDDGERSYEYGPQLSYGVVETVDVIVRPAWLDVRSTSPSGSTRERGFGDTALDFKWRFAESDVYSFGTRAGISLATGDADRGLGSGKSSLHAVLIGQAAIEPWTLIANLGYAQDSVSGERANLWYGTASAVWQPSEALRFSAEVGTFSPQQTDRSGWSAVARFGAIASVTSWLNLDVGYQFRLNHAAPSQVLLAGATLHW